MPQLCKYNLLGLTNSKIVHLSLFSHCGLRYFLLLAGSSRIESLYVTFRLILIGSILMPTFLIISRHSPENCPLNNEKMKKITLELPQKLGDLEKKHGIKRIGVWTVIPEHLTVWVYEAPSSENLQKFSMEPEMIKWMAWNTNEIKLAMSLEESIKLLK